MTRGTFRNKKVYFSQVSNNALRDEKLSLKAKGLYALIQSYITIENFTLYKDTLLKACKEGEKAFNSAWKELKDEGYLIQYKLKDKKGKIYYEYELLDEKEIKKTESIEKATIIPHPQNVPYGKRTCGKGGVFNNTDLNNTYCKYVSMYEKHLKSTNSFKNFLAEIEIDKRMDLDLFENILVNVMNNNRVKIKDRYFLKVLKETLNNGIRTTQDYNLYLEKYNKSKRNTPKANAKASKTPLNGSQAYNKGAGNFKTDNFEDILQNPNLEEMLLESQKR